MDHSKTLDFPNISLSHFELYVDNLLLMEEFYTRCLGFFVTDRGDGKNGMVFLSRNPHEHHQLVLSKKHSDNPFRTPIDHIAFRVDDITKLRVFHQALTNNIIKLQTVSHGTTFSIYFTDPENNRLELFCDTPWHVNQPCRFTIDFAMSNKELLQFTKQRIINLPGFLERNNSTSH